MAYSRRNLSAYQRGASPINILPPATRSLTAYRNKILSVLAATCFYTAFLYQRGQ